MHLAMSGVVAHLYHIQSTLYPGGGRGGIRDWISPDFHRHIGYWKALVAQRAARPTHLENIVLQEPNHMGFCDVSGIGIVGVWLDPYRSGPTIVRHHPWLPDIIATLISKKIQGGC